jgi:hypothetical protein
VDQGREQGPEADRGQGFMWRNTAQRTTAHMTGYDHNAPS